MSDRFTLAALLLIVFATSSGATASISVFRAVSPDVPLQHAPAEYAALVSRAARENEVPAWLLDSLLWEESRYDTSAVHVNSNGTTDRGIPQLNSACIAWFALTFNGGFRINPHNPAQAIPVAARYLAWLYRLFGSWPLAVMAYNAGPGRVMRGDVPEKTREYAARVLL